MKKFLALLFAGLVSLSAATSADGPPNFMKDTLPEHAMMKILESWGAMQGEGATIDAKTRELIALAVSAQIPCDYCVHAHTARLKRQLGASDAEVKEAVAIAGYIRLFSTVFNGNSYDFDKFQAEYDALLAN